MSGGVDLSWSESRPGFKWSRAAPLLKAAPLLVVALTAAVVVELYAANRDLARSRASMAIERTREAARLLLNERFRSIEAELASAVEWGRTGQLDLQDPLGFADRFRPLLATHPAVTSLLLADSLGNEIMLLEDPDGWRTRMTRAGEGPIWREMDAFGNVLNEYVEAPGYDPRLRPWYLRARDSAGGDHPVWTDTYSLRTTGDDGISVTQSFADRGDPDLLLAFGLDVRLTDLGPVLRDISMTAGSFCILIGRRDRILAAAEHALLEGHADPTVLQDVASLEDPLLQEVCSDWRGWDTFTAALTEVRRTVHEGGAWWSGGGRIGWRGTPAFVGVMVPESDLIGDVTGRRNRLLLLGACATVIALALTIGVARLQHGRLVAAIGNRPQVGPYTLLGPGRIEPLFVVYDAVHDLMERPARVLVGLLPATAAERDPRIGRLRTVSELTHRAFPTLFDVGLTEDERLFCALELAPGQPVAARFSEGGQAPPIQAARILAQLMGAVAEAHEVGLVHGDLTAAGAILLTEDDEPMVRLIGLAEKALGGDPFHARLADDLQAICQIGRGLLGDRAAGAIADELRAILVRCESRGDEEPALTAGAAARRLARLVEQPANLGPSRERPAGPDSIPGSSERLPVTSDE